MSKKTGNTGVIRRLDPLGRIVLPKKYRTKCSMEVKDEVEMTLEGSSIFVRKHRPKCRFCGESDNLITFKGMQICSSCVDELKKLRI